MQADSDFVYKGEKDFIPTGDTVEMYQYWNEIIGDHAYIKFRNDGGYGAYSGYEYLQIAFYAIQSIPDN